ncbi:MAG: hypothetical protein AB1586_14570 [Pseudomonadota bacterium]
MALAFGAANVDVWSGAPGRVALRLISSDRLAFPTPASRSNQRTPRTIDTPLVSNDIGPEFDTTDSPFVSGPSVAVEMKNPA